MNLVTVGINHKTAPVEIREKLSFAAEKVVFADRRLKEECSLREGLILSTCNRVEVYAIADTLNKDAAGCVKGFFSRFHSINISDFESRLYVHRDEEAVRHLFKVASGLDSMVIGEVEILGQIKRAYQDARQAQSTGKILNRLLEKAFNTAKKVRTDTFITRGSVSVSSVAVRLAQKILGDLGDKQVLIIGAGTIGEQLVLYLKKSGIKAILVANRTLEKAKALADKFKAEALGFDAFGSRLKDVDIVITSTGAPHHIILKDDVLAVMPKRKQKPLFIIDLAVPRDVEAEVNKADNVYLYDIDDLQKIVDNNIALRKNELESCENLIHLASKRFMEWVVNEAKRQN